jgi:hypothetical protein
MSIRVLAAGATIAFGATVMIAFDAVGTDRFSITGTYEGVVACDDIIDGLSEGFFSPAVVKIVQHGDEIDLMHTYENIEGPVSRLYRGSVRTDPGGDTISGFFEACGGSYPARELARIFPASTSDDGFSFSADSVFQSTAVPGVVGQLVVDSCKYALERTSTTRPDIDTCD